MSQRAKLLLAIGDDIRQDCSDYARLRALMQDMYERLLERDSEQIEALNLEISALNARAQARSQRRSKILGAFRLSQDADGMQRLLATCQPTERDKLQQAWARLGRLAGECRQLNERNGKLLAMHYDILSQLLSSGIEDPLYGPQAF